MGLWDISSMLLCGPARVQVWSHLAAEGPGRVVSGVDRLALPQQLHRRGTVSPGRQHNARRRIRACGMDALKHRRSTIIVPLNFGMTRNPE